MSKDCVHFKTNFAETILVGVRRLSSAFVVIAKVSVEESATRALSFGQSMI